MTPQQIGELIKVAKFGKKIHKLIHQFPRLELEAYIQPITRSCLQVELVITPDFQWDDKIHGTSEPFWIIVEDCDSEVILHYEQFVLKKKYFKNDHTLNFIVPMLEPLNPQYFIRVISDRWINAETLLPISFKHLILPEKFPSHTELLDLQPLQFNVLKNPKVEKLLYSKIPFMNQIQTQTFKVTYESDENIFVGAPTGSGKTFIAEFALLRYFKNQSDGPAIYVTPVEALAKDKYREFSERFGPLGFKVGYLTGQLSLDTKLFEKSKIIICTPDKLDMLTRKWKQRKIVQNINLVIIDEIHLIGEAGSNLEVAISRLRYMGHQMEKHIRFIALSTILANARDLADWLGVIPNNCFNFDLHDRSFQLEIHIQGLDYHQRKVRLLAMSKPMFNALKVHATQDKQVLIYTSDRKTARNTALDLLTHAVCDDNAKMFCLAKDKVFKEKERLMDEILEEKTLAHTLRFGVGYIHDGMKKQEKNLVLDLYKEGIIQILILTHSLIWEVNLFCHMVLIVDPQKYDGKEHRWVDYSIPDMLQIMGRASINVGNQQSGGNDRVRKCFIFCKTSIKEYYKKFLSEPLPVESHLNHFLHDHLNAEVVAKTIEDKQACVDWITWTFMYRRLLQNPNYYNMQGKTNIHLNDYLSEIIDKTLVDLEKSGCISNVENFISSLNYGRIAVFYYVKYSTINLFAQSLTENKKIKNLIDILCSAYEFEDIPIKHGEEAILQQLAEDLTYKIDTTQTENFSFNEPHTKANILLQLYLNHSPIPIDLLADQRIVVEISQKLILSMVDIISNNQWLKPALLSMELSQMIVQAMWITQSSLFQLPHFDNELVETCKKKDINDISDLMNMEDEDRLKILGKLREKELKEVAEVCNR